MPLAPLDELDQQASSANEAAAAEPDLNSENTLRALEEAGMPRAGKVLAEQSPSLAAAVLEHCRWRFVDQRGLEPIANRPGYIVTILRDPERAGFTQDDEMRWHPPPGQPPAKRMIEHPKVAEYLEHIRTFDALPVATQKQLEEFACQQWPLMTRSQANRRSASILAMLEWKKDGRLH